jgi:hypothetical protein
LVVLTAPDDQRWPFSCANHALASQITKSGWSISGQVGDGLAIPEDQAGDRLGGLFV